MEGVGARTRVWWSSVGIAPCLVVSNRKLLNPACFLVMQMTLRPPHLLCLDLPARLLALEDVLSVLIQLQLRDDNLARMDGQRHALAIRLLPRHPLDVHAVFQPVDTLHLALTPLVGPTHDQDLSVRVNGAAKLEWRNGTDLIVFPNGNAPNLRNTSVDTPTGDGPRALKCSWNVRCISRAAPC